MVDADFYTPENDITEVNEQGLNIMLAPAGIPIPLHIAREKGFIKDGVVVGPTEHKAAEPPAETDAERIEAARTIDPSKAVGLITGKKPK